MKRVKDAFDERAEALDGLLGVGRSFDMIGRTLRIGGRRARLWVVNGYADDTVLERAISAWLPIPSLERTRRAKALVGELDELFGPCSLYGECEQACPAGIPLTAIAAVNHERFLAGTRRRL